MAYFETLSYMTSARILCRSFTWIVPAEWTCQEALDRLPSKNIIGSGNVIGVALDGRIVGHVNHSSLLFRTIEHNVADDDSISRDVSLMPLFEVCQPIKRDEAIPADTPFFGCVERLALGNTSVGVLSGENVIGTLDYDDCVSPAGATVILALLLETEHAALELCLLHPGCFADLNSDQRAAVAERWLEKMKKVRADYINDLDMTDDEFSEFCKDPLMIREGIQMTMLIQKFEMIRKARLLSPDRMAEKDVKELGREINNVRNALAHPFVRKLPRDTGDMLIPTAAEDLLRMDVAGFHDFLCRTKSLFAALRSQLALSDL